MTICTFDNALYPNSRSQTLEKLVEDCNLSVAELVYLLGVGFRYFSSKFRHIFTKQTPRSCLTSYNKLFLSLLKKIAKKKFLSQKKFSTLSRAGSTIQNILESSERVPGSKRLQEHQRKSLFSRIEINNNSSFKLIQVENFEFFFCLWW